MKRFFWVIGLLALGGCSTAAYAPNAAVPTTWTDTAAPVNDAALQVRWWEQFNDPILDQLIQTATAQNLDLKIAATRVRAARAQLHSVEASFLPNITGGGSFNRARLSSKTREGQFLSGTSNLYDAEADATWEFNIFSISPALESARATIQATRENQNGVLLSLLGETSNNYIQLRELQQSLALTDQTITAYQTALDLADAREKAGLASGLDTARAESILAAQQAQRPALAAQITDAIRRLEVLLGQNPGTLDSELRAPAQIPVAGSPLLLATPAAVIANRPDVRAAEQSLRASNAAKQVASAEYFPSISLPAAFGWQAEHAQDVFSNGSLMWSLTGGIHIPIFDFGRIRADIDLADAAARQAFFQYQQAVQVALSDVETALSDYLASVNREPQLERAVAADQTTLQLSQDRYDKGLVNYLDVTAAQQALYGAQQAQLQNQADEATRLVTLYKAMGGGWRGEGAAVPAVQQAAAAPILPSAPAMKAETLPVDMRPNAPHVKNKEQKNNAVMVIE